MFYHYSSSKKDLAQFLENYLQWKQGINIHKEECFFISFGLYEDIALKTLIQMDTREAFNQIIYSKKLDMRFEVQGVDQTKTRTRY